MDVNIQSNNIIRPFSGKYRQLSVNKALVFLTLIGAIPVSFSPSILYYLVVMSLLLYLSYFYLQSVFSVGIFMALFYQWIQISIKVLFSITSGNQIEELTPYPAHIYSALYLSTFALLFLSEGMRIKLKKVRYSTVELNNIINQYNTKRIIATYIVFNIVINALSALRFITPGLFQVISILSYFKWSLFVIMMILVTRKKELLLPFIMISGFEFISGFISFFANFRGVIIYTLIGALTLTTITKRHLFIYGFAGFLIYIVAIIWTEIKMDYREFLNQGTRSQAVLVSKSEARNYLYNAITSYNFSNYSETQREFINRISYIDFFSAAQSYVPDQIPHENGKVLQQSISHILMPRLFFPNKPILEDSKHLSKYTGIYFPSYAEGVSFSLGYVGDFYIDFGPWGMLIGIFLFGYLLGTIFLAIHNTSINALWSIGAFSAAFDLLYKFENSQIKFLGNSIYFLIVFLLLNRYVIPRLHQFLIEKS